MIEDTIRKIEESLRGDATASAHRQELLRLLGDLKSELSALEATRQDEARLIARLTETAHRAARAGGDTADRRSSAEGLARSVREFETSHPRLTSVVDAIAETLASAGL